jgi:hypothetical protein
MAMNKPCYSKKEFKQVSGYIHRIINRNNVTKLKEIVDKLEAIGVDSKLLYYHNLKSIMNEMKVGKVDGVYKYVDIISESKVMLECYRCEVLKTSKDFLTVHKYGTKKLKICKQCIREENKITGESLPELVGIYEYLQHRYVKSLDKSMYSKFWEPVIYGKSSSVKV